MRIYVVLCVTSYNGIESAKELNCREEINNKKLNSIWTAIRFFFLTRSLPSPLHIDSNEKIDSEQRRQFIESERKLWRKSQ